MGIVGFRNAGKTGLMERLVGEFTRRGRTVSTLKHAHHSFAIDAPGKDSWRHKNAGAGQVLIACEDRWALMTELRGAPEPPLDTLLTRLDPVDIVLAEGWKSERHPKIECWRAELGHPLLCPDDPSIRALASDTPVDVPCPRYDLDDTAGLADLVLAEIGG